MKCEDCPEKEDKLFTFNDGYISFFFWCNKYDAPCERVVKKCKEEKHAN